MRRDAAANRQRVLDAAEHVFAGQGPDASTEEVARHAGVGIGTVFRHFPTKRDLVEAVMLARFQGLTERARAADSSTEATAALLGLIGELVDLVAAKREMASYLFGCREWSGAAKQASDELVAAIGRLLRRAQEKGGVREDIGVEELSFLIRGLAQPTPPGTSRDAIRQQAIRIVLDGLRTPRPG